MENPDISAPLAGGGALGDLRRHHGSAFS